MKRSFRVAGLLFVIAFGGCSSSDVGPGSGERVSASRQALQLGGSVRNESGAALSGVSIELRTTTGSPVASGVSGVDGRYALNPAVVPDGTYDVIATPPSDSGYVRQVFPAQPFAGSANFDIVLVRVQSSRVSGTLADAGGTGIANVSVCLQGSESFCTQTDGNGFFAISVADGSYPLTFNGYWYPTTGGYSYFYLNRSEALVVDRNVNLGPILLPTAPISGQVVNSDGVRVSEGSVRTTGSWSVSTSGLSGWWSGSTPVGSDGRFYLAALSGSGELVAESPGFPVVRAQATAGDEALTIELPVPRVVSGTLLDAGSNAISNVSVCLYGTGDSCAQTDANGVFAISVADGSYTLAFNGYWYPTTGGYSYFNLNQSEQLSVDRSVNLGSILLPTAPISGQVVNPDGVRVSEGNVRTAGSWSVSTPGFSGWWSGNTPVGSDGGFYLAAMLGSGELVAESPGFPAVRAQATAGDEALTIQLPVPRVVSGTLLDAGSNAISNVSACLYGTENSCAQTDANGSFAVSVADGAYTLEFNGYWYPATGGYSYFYLNQNEQLSVDRSVNLGPIHLPTAPISGQILDPDGFPAQGVSVSTWGSWSLSSGPFTGHWSGNVPTAASGRFRLMGFQGSGTLSVRPSDISGFLPVRIDGVDLGEAYSLGVSIQFEPETLTAVVDPGQSLTTDSEGDGATFSDPVETTVRRPHGALSPDPITITEGPIDGEPLTNCDGAFPRPRGIRFLTQQVDISAVGGPPTDPLEITFSIDCSRFYPRDCSPETLLSARVFRNGLCVEACTNADPHDYEAAPNPCYKPPVLVGDPVTGDVRFTVLTRNPSAWNFALLLPDDADGDRIPDSEDACPNEPEDLDGNADTDGCPEIEDQDGDTIQDFEDSCVTEPEDFDGHDDSDGCPEVEDQDSDGIDDAVDACPAEPEDLDGHDDSDGCPEVEDQDGDGIVDSVDACPTKAEDLDGQDDEDGCPEPDPIACADFDGNGRVALRDLVLLTARVGAAASSPRFDPRFDLDRDRHITLADLALALGQLGRHC